jgi:hypothetical protein
VKRLCSSELVIACGGGTKDLWVIRPNPESVSKTPLIARSAVFLIPERIRTTGLRVTRNCCVSRWEPCFQLDVAGLVCYDPRRDRLIGVRGLQAIDPASIRYPTIDIGQDGKRRPGFFS